ncbi:TPA_asm: MC090R [Molluscum contagiosum virus]|uniref:mRNA-capping enzyme catalytic subunit n=3 Tax=Molluscum contagiosum virus TaxID=10279 RepID=A0A858A3E0_9POXV|nr:MC090 [Molluscum contagiosum virus subtype 1]QHW17896.1 MC090R [Molluscum contagiosum virus]AYO88409.1 MC090 [Molluscum contagiosum virus subtype 1]AYO88585.1 MC090 [Molluscum contagiosum virus subtype 1]AYO88939.1 MC090 [Molluscum contagiosum virus subtype 1]
MDEHLERPLEYYFRELVAEFERAVRRGDSAVKKNSPKRSRAPQSLTNSKGNAGGKAEPEPELENGNTGAGAPKARTRAAPEAQAAHPPVSAHKSRPRAHAAFTSRARTEEREPGPALEPVHGPASAPAPAADTTSDVHHEVELIFVRPPLVTLSHLLGIATRQESYVLFSLTSLEREGVKLRTRLPLARVHGLDMKNNQLVEAIDSILWEKKTRVAQRDFPEAHCLLRHSTEEQYVFLDFRNFNSAIRLELVNHVQARVRNIVVDFKLKYFLGSGAQTRNSLLAVLNYPKFRPSVTLEFEVLLRDPAAFSPRELLRELLVLGNLLFMAPAEHVFLMPAPKEPLTTHMLKKQDLLTLELRDLYVTGKTDGVPTFVHVAGASVYCFFSHLGYAIRYPARVTLPAPVALFGEAVRDAQSKQLTVYLIKLMAPALEDRLEEREFVLRRLQGLCERVAFQAKQYEGPFATSSELTDALAQMLAAQPEGVVLFYARGSRSGADLKLKRDNTVDQAVNVIYRYMSSEPVIFGDGVTFLEFKRFSNDKGFPKEFGTGRLVLAEGARYLNNIYCLEFADTHSGVGLRKVVVPVKFVGEFSHDGRLLRPRLAKTMLYLSNANYYGNQASVVLEHLQDQRLRVGDVFREDKLADAGKAAAVADAHRLNPDTAYFTKRRVRGPLGVLSNYVKTLLISLYCSKTFFDNPNKRKVLAVDFGNGADLEKYFYGEIALLIATDPDARAIECGRERYNKLNSGNKSKYYKFDYIQETIRSESFVASVREVFYFGKFDIVDWQFAIHYSFHPRHYATVMRNLAELTASGCRVLITTVDGDFLATLTRKRSFVIHRDLPEPENYISFEKLDSEHVLVYNPSTMAKPMVEYIVRKQALVRVFGEYGFVLVDHVDFHTVVHRSRAFIDGVAQMESRTSTKNFFELNRAALQSCRGLDVEELLQYYVVYVFAKR